jgi:hypothetical protein
LGFGLHRKATDLLPIGIESQLAAHLDDRRDSLNPALGSRRRQVNSGRGSRTGGSETSRQSRKAKAAMEKVPK